MNKGSRPHIRIESGCFEHIKTLYFKTLQRFVLQIIFGRKFVTKFVTFFRANTIKRLQARNKTKYIKAKVISLLRHKPLISWHKKSGVFCRFCVPSGTRTLDPLIKSQLLYQLS